MIREMIVSKFSTLFGLVIVPAPTRQEIDRVIRHAKAAAFQHRKLNANVQTDSLDRIEEHVCAPQTSELAEATDRLSRATKQPSDIRNALAGLVKRLD